MHFGGTATSVEWCGYFSGTYNTSANVISPITWFLIMWFWEAVCFIKYRIVIWSVDALPFVYFLCTFFSGAVQSGYRATAEVLQDLHPDSLSSQDLKLIEELQPKIHHRKDGKTSWLKKYPSGRNFITMKFVLGFGLGILLMHSKWQFWPKIRDCFWKKWQGGIT